MWRLETLQLLLCVVLFIFFQGYHEDAVILEYHVQAHLLTSIRINWRDIALGSMIGSGGFGAVYKATYQVRSRSICGRLHIINP